jgi:quinone-modifying oxidoreductase subunit QmoA
VCKGSQCGECVKVCKYAAIDLAAKETVEEIAVTSVVFATGWAPYDAASIANLGYGTVQNVVTNVEMERIAAPSGPTGGAIHRPGTDEPAKQVVFVQCAGSRDENHLPYCSSVCCMASLKQARYVRAQYPDAQVTVFYIDLRAPGKYEGFLNTAEQDTGIRMVKGKVAKVEVGENGRALVTAEDILNGGKVTVEADLVVLATGMKPQTPAIEGIAIDPDRFVKYGHRGPGIFSVGVAARPVDVTTTVRDATAVAIATMKS